MAYWEKYNALHPDRRTQSVRDYHRAHKEQEGLYRETHRDAKRLYDSNNKDKKRERENRRYKEDPQYRIEKSTRSRIYAALKGRGKKSARTVELLGCPLCWLVLHLESLFSPGMTWENYGKVWHVDHVRPCVVFELSRPEHQQWCFHWTNLQPLFAEENLKKGGRLVFG